MSDTTTQKEINELRGLSAAELEQRVIEWRREQFKLRTRRAVSGQEEEPHRYRQLRRSIARAKTLLKEGGQS